MATYPKVKVAEGQLTAAHVNANTRAGTKIVEPVAGKTLTAVDCWLRAIGGNAGGATAVVLEDTNGTDAVSYAVAALTDLFQDLEAPELPGLARRLDGWHGGPSR